MPALYPAIVKPTLLLDEQAARANLHRMRLKAAKADVRFRPHFKTHQSIEIGEWFRQEGVEAITVSSLDMAEYFTSAGWRDITLAFSVNPRQIAAMDRLASRIRLGLLVESEEAVDALRDGLSHPVDIWLKIDAGTGRTGLPWHATERIVALARQVNGVPHMHLCGLLTHAGNTYTAQDGQSALQIAAQEAGRLSALRTSMENAGLGRLLVSTGDTPGCSAAENFPSVDEIRPGNFIFFDAKQASAGACTWDDIAVALACPVVALHPQRGEVVVYGGAIHLSKDTYFWNGKQVYGRIALPPRENSGRWGRPLAHSYVARLSQEHGILSMPAEEIIHLRLGDLVFILPAHSCLTAQCMGSYLSLVGQRIAMMPANLPDEVIN
jgi:D-serine deaminase-like pyridoxal phosphate-dependent protein